MRLLTAAAPALHYQMGSAWLSKSSVARAQSRSAASLHRIMRPPHLLLPHFPLPPPQLLPPPPPLRLTVANPAATAAAAAAGTDTQDPAGRQPAAGGTAGPAAAALPPLPRLRPALHLRRWQAMPPRPK